MAAALYDADQDNLGRMARLWLWLDRAYDLIFSDANRTALKQLAIQLSIAGFVIHLLLIFLARTLTYPPHVIAAAGQNYLAAISTPFNFILFYEVLTLIAALPASTTRSIANQFEIVSLIFIRDAFRDIARASDLVTEHRLTMEALPLFMDMGAGFLMFLLLAVFQHLAQKRAGTSITEIPSREMMRFIAQKRLVAASLAVLLLTMAAYSLGVFALAISRNVMTGQYAAEITTTFYNDMYTVMIFTDVLVLILSLTVSGQYEMVFRNAAFVVSIILIRFSLTEGHPYGAPLAILSIVFGVLTLMVFNYHVRINRQRSG
jgi:hypothetical protein